MAMAQQPIAPDEVSGFAYVNGVSTLLHSDASIRFERATVVLGAKAVRLFAQGLFPGVLIGGQALDLRQYQARRVEPSATTRAEIIYYAVFYVRSARYVVEVLVFDECMLDLRLTEPDGVIWTARCGYHFGEAYPNSEETAMYSPRPWQEYGVAL